MTRATAARRCALALVSERRRRGARIRELLRASKEVSALPPRERALATRLALGCVAAEGALDHAIDAHLRPGARLEPRVRDALHLAAFETLYLSTRADVCVSQGVELVRRVAPRAAGLANAVLHRVAAEDAPALEAARARLESGVVVPSDLALVGGLPEWLADRALSSLGSARAASWAARALEPAGAWVAANRVRHTTEEALALLADAGCAPEAGPLPGSALLAAPAALAPSGLVEAVDVLPCDLAAQVVVQDAAPAPGTRVLEVGSGRGTKTILLEGAALAAGGMCEIVAVESDAHRSERAAKRLVSAGMSDCARCLAADARTLTEELLGTFDLVFVDAPCTGSGTLARHPEIAWSLEPSAPDALARLQGQILAAVAPLVAPGGRLVYATCSVLAEEDEDVVRALLASSAGAGLELVDQARTDLSHADTHFRATLRRR